MVNYNLILVLKKNIYNNNAIQTFNSSVQFIKHYKLSL